MPFATEAWHMALLKYFEGEEVTLITRYGVPILVLNGLQRLTRGCEAEGRWSTRNAHHYLAWPDPFCAGHYQLEIGAHAKVEWSCRARLYSLQ